MHAQCLLDIVERNQWITEQARDSEEVDTSIETMAVLVERDGATRNSLAADDVHKFYKRETAVINERYVNCMWLIKESFYTLV